MLAADERSARLRAFGAMERDHRLFDHRVDGWSPWRIIRFPVYQSVVDLPFRGDGPAKLRRVAHALPSTATMLWSMAAAGRRDLFIKSFRTAVRQPDGGRFRDIYFDDVLDLGYSSFKLENVNSPNFGAQAAAAVRRADLNSVAFTVWGRVLGGLRPADARGFCETVASLLARNFSIVIDPDWLLMRVSTAYWQARLYEKLLRRIKPRCVLVADTGEYALCIAARRLGIPFIELQHGVFDDDHPDAMPVWVKGSAAELVLPDILACHGRYWIERLAQSRQGGDCARAVGNHLVDLARRRRAVAQPRAHRHIVVTTQGVDTDRLVQWLRELVAAAPIGVEWRMTIKLHPMFDASESPYGGLARDPRIAIVGGSQTPTTWDLLATADLHLSISSACHFDAAAVGVPSVVIPLAGHEIMLSACDAGHFVLGREFDSVWDFATRSVSNQKSMCYFAVPGFVSNLRETLRSVTGNTHASKVGCGENL